MAVKNDYKNFVPPLSGRKFKITDNGDGTVSIEDVTEYAQVGDIWGAGDANAFAEAVNSLNNARVQTYNAPYTILASGWTENATAGRKEYKVESGAITTLSYPKIVLPNELAGKYSISSDPEPYDGYMLLYTRDMVPEEDMEAQLIIEEVIEIE